MGKPAKCVAANSIAGTCGDASSNPGSVISKELRQSTELTCYKFLTLSRGRLTFMVKQTEPGRKLRAAVGPGEVNDSFTTGAL